ncbi:MAG: CapA family protein, partial [Clostridia bacterium]|nr:CapA family protein [Clostridia bacterium]
MQYFRKAAGCLLFAGLLLSGCGGQSGINNEDGQEPLAETEVTTEDPAEDRETVPMGDDVPDTPETEPAVPAAPSGETLAAGIAALPDSDILRQSDIADVATAENLASLPDAQRILLEEALNGCNSLTAYRTAFHRITGYTFHAWRDVLYGASAGTCETTPYEDGTASLIFTGDVCLGDEWYNMQAYHRMGSDIQNNITEEVRGWLAAADVALMNCECTLSDRGTPTPGKLYTFRGKPENAEIFAELGVDIVSLANNHAHDYGQDAFLDTMTALENAGVVHVGAGETLAEAMEYRSFVADG